MNTPDEISLLYVYLLVFDTDSVGTNCATQSLCLGYIYFTVDYNGRYSVQ